MDEVSRRSDLSANGASSGPRFDCEARCCGESGVWRREDRLVMLHLGKGIIVVMEEALPFLVFGRLSKALRVILQRFPIHEEYVPRGSLQAALQLMGDMALHRRNDGPCLSKRPLEPSFFPGNYVEYRYFQDHRLGGLTVCASVAGFSERALPKRLVFDARPYHGSANSGTPAVC